MQTKEVKTVAEESLASGEVIGKVLGEGRAEAVRATVGGLVQLVMVLGANKLAGAGLHERSDGRRAH
ncbi:MAG: hypothetical protein VKO21_10635 [Candidatus Sericytochromatia bacterium]|nr:hypothetical protein [Candidatus Sericytochromatia bacterium]